MGLKSSEGLSFFAFPGVSSPNLFKQLYRSRMNSVELTEEERNGVLEEAVRAFELNIQVQSDNSRAEKPLNRNVTLRDKDKPLPLLLFIKPEAADGRSFFCFTGLWWLTEDAECHWKQAAESFNTLQTSKDTPDLRKYYQNYPPAQDGPRTFCGSGYSQYGNLRFLEKKHNNKYYVFAVKVLRYLLLYCKTIKNPYLIIIL